MSVWQFCKKKKKPPNRSPMVGESDTKTARVRIEYLPVMFYNLRLIADRVIKVYVNVIYCIQTDT